MSLYIGNSKVTGVQRVPASQWGEIYGTLSNQEDLQNALNEKQETLVSGTNIKTINGETLLGEGGITIEAGNTAIWGDIEGTLSNQEDLQEALNEKQETLVSGTNIKTINGETLLGEGDVTLETTTTWGTIEGTLSNQIDLQTVLEGKQETLVSGTNIKTINGETLLGEGGITIEAGNTAIWGDIEGTLSEQTDLQNALNDKLDRTAYVVDTSLSIYSTNPVQNKVVTSSLNNKQETLISGTNIKTINGSSILGNGNISVSASVSWGSISGTLSNQTDLQTALDSKQSTARTINVLANSGTINLTDNSINSTTPTGTITFKLPTVSSNTTFHQILVQISMTAARTINVGTTYFFNNAAPNMSTAGVYNLYYEYDKNKGYWVCGAMSKGAVS